VLGSVSAHYEEHVRRWLAERGYAGRLIVNVLGSCAVRPTKDMIVWPTTSLAAHHPSDAIQSSAITGVPSCQSRSPLNVKTWVT
jgi:hypothetical protein